MYFFEIFVKGYVYPLQLTLEFSNTKEAEDTATTMLNMMHNIETVRIYKTSYMRTNIVNVIRG